MKHFKPRILVSRCLEHKACRYDGSMISDAFVKRLKTRLCGHYYQVSRSGYWHVYTQRGH